jgi:hypothetical protein
MNAPHAFGPLRTKERRAHLAVLPQRIVDVLELLQHAAVARTPLGGAHDGKDVDVVHRARRDHLAHQPAEHALRRIRDRAQD